MQSVWEKPVELDVSAELRRKPSMLDWLVDLLFRCRHRRLSRPMSPRSEPGSPPGEAFKVCLDCGKRFAYDVKTMRFKARKGAARGPTRPLKDH